ncbi:hypothetical protein [Egbenema bharatensis]|uniref:hypothetical protein n=1 Tax=Egbenema bharatensis TaxID=3463334 RepID=UPI003A8B5AB8
MATSGRYQSKLFSFFSEQSLRLRDQTTETWRRVKIAATWSAQIVLYPIYLAFQSTRLVGKQLRQTARQVFPQLRAARQSIQNPDLSFSSPEAIAPASDTPIQNVLQAAIHLTQTLPASALLEPLGGQDAHPTRALSPDSLPEPLGEQDAHPTRASSPSSLPEPLGGQDAHPTRALSPDSLPTPDSSFLPPPSSLSPQSSVLSPIQSIASLLDTRSLVLVSTDNQLLDILTPDQQTQLYRRMIWELADYYHQQKALGLQQPVALKSPVVNNFLPLPADRPNALLPIRVFHGLMAWMQTSPVAIAANLFQESQLVSLHPAEISGSRSVQERPQLPAASGNSLRSAELPWLSLKEIFQGLGDRVSSQQVSSQQALSQQASPQTPSQPLLTRFINWLKPGAIAPSTAGSPSGTIADSLAHTQPDRNAPAQPSPWLTVEDLFGKIRTFQTQSNPSEDWELHDTAQSNRLIKHQAATLKTADPSQPLSVAPTTSAATLSKVDNTASAETDLALSITTIEAEVSLVTYVKHPLEQVLEWLDRGMVWIEERVAKVLGWWRDRLKGG